MARQAKEAVRIGIFSRIDYGSKGFRKGLIDLAYEVFQQELVHFIVLAGGLVSFNSLKSQMPKDKTERETFLDQVAMELAEIFPEIKKEDGEVVKTHILTSSANNYDGWIGAQVAQRLTKLRKDIKFYKDSAIFPLTQLNKGSWKKIWVLTPQKASWRTKYYSTPIDRLVEDKQKQSTQELPDLYVCGCFASSILKPEGEQERPFISVPALHRVEEVTTSENQIGILVVEFPSQKDEYFVRTYNFKDFVSSEREQIDVETTLSWRHKRTLKALREFGPLTIGLLEDKTSIPRSTIEKVIKEINDSGLRPQIHFDEESQRYDFDIKCMQKKLSYKLPEKNINEDSLVGFGCLHAGSIYTGYRFFVEDVPEFIVNHGASILIGAGDFIEGLKHELILRGEVFAGLNYTQQEKFAANLVGMVISKVFNARIEEKLVGVTGKIKNGKLAKIVSDALLDFYYIPGNHDLWQKDVGVTPLTVFRNELVRFLTQNIESKLKEKNLHLYGLMELIERKVLEGPVHNLPSGLCLEIFHPHMARAQTTSLRAQSMLKKSRCQIVIGANFHTAVGVDEWNPGIGQRSALQLGAIVTKTDFEENKLKRLDFGIGFLKVKSCDGKIFMTEKTFFGKPEETVLNNEKALDNLLDELQAPRSKV